MQVQELDMRNSKPKVVVADSLYGNHFFLTIFQMLKNTFALVRLRSNLTFFEQPLTRAKGKKALPVNMA